MGDLLRPDGEGSGNLRASLAVQLALLKCAVGTEETNLAHAHGPLVRLHGKRHTVDVGWVGLRDFGHDLS